MRLRAIEGGPSQLGSVIGTAVLWDGTSIINGVTGHVLQLPNWDGNTAEEVLEKYRKLGTLWLLDEDLGRDYSVQTGSPESSWVYALHFTQHACGDQILKRLPPLPVDFVSEDKRTYVFQGRKTYRALSSLVAKTQLDLAWGSQTLEEWILWVHEAACFDGHDPVVWAHTSLMDDLTGEEDRGYRDEVVRHILSTEDFKVYQESLKALRSRPLPPTITQEP